MKKASIYLFLLLPFLTLSIAQAQVTTAQPLPPTFSLKIDGTGSLKVVPDLAVLNMTVKATSPDFNQAVKELHAKIERLQQKLMKAGFEREEIKTSQLNVQENGEWREGEYRQIGYAATQHIELKFKRDPKRVTKLMEAFAKEQGAEALFHFGFTLSDEAKKEAEEKLIQRAIADARSKAAVIAKASGVSLGKIQHIVYGQPSVHPLPMYEMDMRAASAAPKQESAGMEVKEIEMNDQITIFWNIQ
ncbi:SIMPL domain-containing protein [Nafulsella turpanensis]|uniref:SIMPL domain-containing protein n=1 Tax=Nafulsella turpanensis TaxID=1265690 RepID=UPI000349F534|nr:SIMPL domain-containing protein [Nafulsella turpanensis]